MLSVDPQGSITLCRCDLEEDQTNQLTFANVTAQNNYFNGLTKKVISTGDYTYMKKDSAIVIELPYDEAIRYNYVFYVNKGFSTKTYFAFITDYEWASENATIIHVKTDVWQTWQFDVNITKCFVEREHVNDDRTGYNTIDEGLNVNNYVIDDVTNVSLSSTSDWICLQVSDFPFSLDEVTQSIKKVYGGVYSGCWLLLFPNTTTGLQNLDQWIKGYDSANRANAIVSLFMVPDDFASQAASYQFGTTGYGCEVMTYTDEFINVATTTITKPTTVDGYTPKNNKMKTWPFQYFYYTNNGGTSADFRYEDFNGNPNFKTDATITPGLSAKTYPTNYKGSTNDGGYNYGVVNAKLPIGSWNSDAYTNWLTQNGLSTAINGVTSFLSNALTLNVVGAVGAVANSINSVNVASQMPDQAKGNVNAGDISYAKGLVGGTFYKMSMKAEIAKSYDEYMSMFGYKVNRVKTPNVTGRPNWNYVKTISCNFTGPSVPQKDVEEIRTMFDNGITLWHNPSTFGNYSLDNYATTR